MIYSLWLCQKIIFMWNKTKKGMEKIEMFCGVTGLKGNV